MKIIDKAMKCECERVETEMVYEIGDVFRNISRDVFHYDGCLFSCEYILCRADTNSNRVNLVRVNDDTRWWTSSVQVVDLNAITIAELEDLIGVKHVLDFTYVRHESPVPRLYVKTSGMSLEESRLNKQPMNINHIRKGDFVRFMGWNNSSDRSWHGDVMKVEAVDYPMLVMSNVSGKNKSTMGKAYMHNFDVTKIKLDYPSQEYIELVCWE